MCGYKYRNGGRYSKSRHIYSEMRLRVDSGLNVLPMMEREEFLQNHSVKLYVG